MMSFITEVEDSATYSLVLELTSMSRPWIFSSSYSPLSLQEPPTNALWFLSLGLLSFRVVHESTLLFKGTLKVFSTPWRTLCLQLPN
ncbi:hypothetical protein Tco_1195023 [Tanacetum coccineum]